MERLNNKEKARKVAMLFWIRILNLLREIKNSGGTLDVAIRAMEDMIRERYGVDVKNAKGE